jgi:hypothetical protein
VSTSRCSSGHAGVLKLGDQPRDPAVFAAAEDLDELVVPRRLDWAGQPDRDEVRLHDPRESIDQRAELDAAIGALRLLSQSRTVLGVTRVAAAIRFGISVERLRFAPWRRRGLSAAKPPAPTSQPPAPLCLPCGIGVCAGAALKHVFAFLRRTGESADRLCCRDIGDIRDDRKRDNWLASPPGSDRVALGGIDSG